MNVQRLGEIGGNKLTLELYETMRKDKGAFEACPWLGDLQRNYDKVVDLGENGFLFCETCYVLTMRDIELYEVP